MEKETRLKQPNWLIIIALTIVPLTGAIWFGFVSVAPLPFDSAWHSMFIAPEGSFFFYISYVFHIVGSTKGMAVVSFIILSITLVMRKWSHALTISVTMVAVLIASKAIKFFVDRPRPVDMIVAETETSFPSGHSLGAGAIATVLVCFVYANDRFGKTSKIVSIFLGATYIVIMILSRTGLHVHWLSDTIAGATLGIVLALTFARLFLFRQTPLFKSRGKHALLES